MKSLPLVESELSEEWFYIQRKIDHIIDRERGSFHLHARHPEKVDSQTSMFDWNGEARTYWRKPFNDVLDWFAAKWFKSSVFDQDVHFHTESMVYDRVIMERDERIRKSGYTSARPAPAWDNPNYIRLVPGYPFRHLKQLLLPVVFEVVYFTQRIDTGEIKIGFTGNLKSRMRTISAQQKCCLSVLATICGGRQAERCLHLRFANARIRGEWFRPTPELLAYIATIHKRPTQ